MFRFAVKYLQVLLLWLALLGNNFAWGLQCLECHEVYNPDDCSLVGTCGKDEVCFTHSFINFRDRTAYRMGCIYKDVCEFYKTNPLILGRREVSGAVCRQCCDQDVCNKFLCSEAQTLTSEKPVPVHQTSAMQSAAQSTSTSKPGVTAAGQTTSGRDLRDCMDIINIGVTTSGIYAISPDGLSPFNVYCDMTTDGGGWVVIQHRFNGSVDFHRNWEMYKHGFGSLSSEFWLGNEYIHRLTSQAGRQYTLRFDLTAENGTTYTAVYDNFTVGPESDGYRVNFTTYHGTAGDSFQAHRGMQFSTDNHDNDDGSQNCAKLYRGGWWYHKCYEVNINGVYGSTGDVGLIWVGITGWTGSLLTTKMSLRAN